MDGYAFVVNIQFFFRFYCVVRQCMAIHLQACEIKTEDLISRIFQLNTADIVEHLIIKHCDKMLIFYLHFLFHFHSAFFSRLNTCISVYPRKFHLFPFFAVSFSINGYNNVDIQNFCFPLY